MLSRHPATRLCGVLFCSLTLGLTALGMDHVTVRRQGKTSEAVGRVLIEAQDGGLALLARDGVLWLIPPEEKVTRTRDAAEFSSLGRDALGRGLLAELPQGFQIYSTPHYLICYDTSREYAQWCGTLFEQLYRAFHNYWTRRGVELSEPKFPLVAVVFANKAAYLRFSQSELGQAGESISGFYSLLTNRMTMYDITGADGRGGGRGVSAKINQILSQPGASRTVATVVHEATHQIAFNCGLHQRLSDCPRWFSEGIAMFFETPDLRGGAKRGWSGIGTVNPSRLERFQEFLQSRPANSLETLLRDDRRFTDAKQAVDAYAEAWALTYFLLKKHEKDYVAYLRTLSAKKTLMQDKPEQRIDEFRKAFGELPKVDAEFQRFFVKGR
ncbi:MAG: DUF1570 domain-containing protein [Planctomycetaceae bacterium]|nr:DUF1570 domain-containing protein [Planctomycetaceae bacterium]